MDKMAELAIKSKLSGASESLGLDKVSKSMGKMHDWMDGTAAAEKAAKEKEAAEKAAGVSTGTKILNSLMTSDMKANAAIKAKKADREKRKEEVRAELEAKYRNHQPSEQETVTPASPPAASSTGFGGIMGKMKSGVSVGTGALVSMTKDVKKMAGLENVEEAKAAAAATAAEEAKERARARREHEEEEAASLEAEVSKQKAREQEEAAKSGGAAGNMKSMLTGVAGGGVAAVSTVTSMGASVGNKLGSGLMSGGAKLTSLFGGKESGK